jgi:hypothetical protein
MLTRATLVSFDAGTYTATIRPPGSAARAVGGVPVSRSITSGELLAGRLVAVSWFTPGDPTDAVVFAVWA